MTKLEKGRIVAQGMGGFICPPGHPAHTHSVETDLRKKQENRGGMSLEAAVKCEYLDKETRKAAKDLLRNYYEVSKPPLESEEIQKWVHQVLGYFQHCYIPASGSKNVSDLIIDKERQALDNIDTHRGVDYIREHYPEFKPTLSHFVNAKWGD